MMRSSMCGVGLVCALSGLLSACGAGGDGPGAAEESASEVSLALATVPTGVQCIQVNVTSGGASLVTQNFAASGAGWMATVGLGNFSKGSVTVAANAYNAACSAIGTATPTWVADWATIDVTPGRPNPVTLTFRQNFGVAATGNFAPSVVDIAVGYYSSGVVFSDGTVKVFGVVSQPTGLSNVVELGLGYYHGCARKNDGSVWCWGTNNHGQLGNGTLNSATTPVQVNLGSPALGIAVGYDASCAALGPYGTTYCWGYNAYSQFGSFGTSSDQATPLYVGWNSKSIGVGSTDTCFVDNGSLKVACAGTNNVGQLGNGTTVITSGSVISSNTSSAQVTVGTQHVCAVDGTGHLWCWGGNSIGQLGLGTQTNVLVPTLVPLPALVAEVVASEYGTCARTTAGAVYCWGYNFYGTVGDSTNNTRTTPVLVLNGSRKLRASGEHVCSLQTDASVQCWGYNGSGELGDGTYTTSAKPTPMKL